VRSHQDFTVGYFMARRRRRLAVAVAQLHSQFYVIILRYVMLLTYDFDFLFT